MNWKILLLSLVISLVVGLFVVKTSIDSPIYTSIGLSNSDVSSSNELIKAMYSVDPSEVREALNLKVVILNYDGEISTHISREIGRAHV